ncbi:Similar to S.cerevisiae protein KTI12 (Protein that plays a role in modification of tRNA wobble nucleosides) [Malassezia sympodialis ATCC 42132]|uniref:Similar to S.cerevisiae protein KTI12 (Protein that plays a role in modification of tRNA wobble nucleosides) n=1 Tax=Malassezia sympodialis (strain ATCC 42132) TaxID=1230383 RepID=A0A1M8A4B4_MALS4|nr:Similar to S.cerevisiae protein KTI12 (Protein that plays a role in modification of tRNA wobble nucleosides) [Malassezia sympodialis ATCC 42132]
MALLVVTGLPSSGRSTRVDELARFLEPKIADHATLSQVKIVRGEDVHADLSVYESQKSESRARAAYLSAVRRALNQRTIVIADGGPGLNIKGSRYELWCATRELGLRCATLYVACPVDLGRSWNQERRAAGHMAYTDTCFDELAFRFEEPTSDARWHRPLFTAVSSCLDNKLEILPTPLEEIWEALTQSAVQPPKSVTLVRKKTANNYLELLDNTTHAVLNSLAEQRTLGTPMAGRVYLPLPAYMASAPLVLDVPPLSAFPSPARLQTMRRQFVRIYASKAEQGDGLPLASHEAPERHIAQLFVAWLQECIASNKTP